jgi:hypothetical protein
MKQSCTPGPWQLWEGQIWGGCLNDPSGQHFLVARVCYPQPDLQQPSTLEAWRDNDARLLVAAANAAIRVNPGDPLAAAEALPDAVRDLGELVQAVEALAQRQDLPAKLRFAATKGRASLAKAGVLARPAASQPGIELMEEDLQVVAVPRDGERECVEDSPNGKVMAAGRIGALPGAQD